MRRWVLMLIAANLMVLVALTFVYPQFMVSPGALITAHVELTTNCFACHAPLRGAASTRCATCHAAADIGLRTTKGLPLNRPVAKSAFHQELIAQDCMACHSDHEGPKLTGHSRKSFSHALLRPASRDSCESCHTAPKTAVHSDAKARCSQCHAQDHWKPATFDHAKLFVLDRDHNVACVTCHTNSDYKKYTCYGCHEHTPDKVRREHVKEGIQDYENCVRCHRSAHEKPRNEGSRETPRRRRD